jgi:polyhydroxyalkanoate synthesis regulator protein
MESMTNPLSAMPGFDAMRAQQEAFMKAMTGGMGDGWKGKQAGDEEEPSNDLDEIRRQLEAMQKQLSKMGGKGK